MSETQGLLRQQIEETSLVKGKTLAALLAEMRLTSSSTGVGAIDPSSFGRMVDAYIRGLASDEAPEEYFTPESVAAAYKLGVEDSRLTLQSLL